MMNLTPAPRPRGMNDAMVFLEVAKSQKLLDAACRKIDDRLDAANKAIREAKAREKSLKVTETEQETREQAMAAERHRLDTCGAGQNERDAGQDAREKSLNARDGKLAADRRAFNDGVKKTEAAHAEKVKALHDSQEAVAAGEAAAERKVKAAETEMTKAREMKAEAEATLKRMGAAMGGSG